MVDDLQATALGPHLQHPPVTALLQPEPRIGIAGQSQSLEPDLGGQQGLGQTDLNPPLALNELEGGRAGPLPQHPALAIAQPQSR